MPRPYPTYHLLTLPHVPSPGGVAALRPRPVLVLLTVARTTKHPDLQASSATICIVGVSTTGQVLPKSIYASPDEPAAFIHRASPDELSAFIPVPHLISRQRCSSILGAASSSFITRLLLQRRSAAAEARGLQPKQAKLNHPSDPTYKKFTEPEKTIYILCDNDLRLQF